MDNAKNYQEMHKRKINLLESNKHNEIEKINKNKNITPYNKSSLISNITNEYDKEIKKENNIYQTILKLIEQDKTIQIPKDVNELLNKYIPNYNNNNTDSNTNNNTNNSNTNNSTTNNNNTNNNS